MKKKNYQVYYNPNYGNVAYNNYQYNNAQFNMNNVKNYGVNRNKKYKTKKITKKLVAIGLSIALLAGFVKWITPSHNNSYHSNSSSYSSSYTTTTPNNQVEETNDYFIIQSGDDEAVIDDGNFIILNGSESAYNNFNNYLDDYKVNVAYQDMFNIDKYYKQSLEDKKNDNNSSNLVVSGKLSYDRLLEKVMSNNEIYLEKEKNMKAVFYEDMKRSDIKEICMLITNTINEKAENDPSIDINKVASNLEGLKIFKDECSPANAYVTSDMVLAVNQRFIKKVFNKMNSKDNELSVIVHEIMHLIQYASSDLNNDNGTEIGPFVKYDDKEEVNPLYCSWFLESSAEYAMCEYLECDPTTYTTPIKYMNTIKLLNVVNGESGIYDVEKVSFSNSYNKIYSLFDAETEEERKEVMAIMYGMEVALQGDKNFSNAYESKYGVGIENNEEERVKVKKEISRDVMILLTKYYYKNLAKNIESGKMTMEDTFYLMRLWEADIYSHTEYNYQKNYDVYKELIDSYNDIQNEFFEYLSKCSNYSKDDIIDMYSNYSMNISVSSSTKANYSLSIYDQDKKNYIEKRKDVLYKTGLPRFYEINEKIEGLSKTK